MSHSVLRTPLKHVHKIDTEISFTILELSKTKIVLDANINPRSLIEKGFPEEILDKIKDAVGRFVARSIKVSNKEIKVSNYNNTYLIVPIKKDLEFDTSELEAYMNMKKTYYYNKSTFVEEKI
jgi:hypothetical protein